MIVIVTIVIKVIFRFKKVIMPCRAIIIYIFIPGEQGIERHDNLGQRFIAINTYIVYER